MVMLRCGIVVAVGSVGMAAIAAVTIMYCIMVVSVMKSSMVRRFFGVVQWSMRRFLGWLVMVFVRLFVSRSV